MRFVHTALPARVRFGCGVVSAVGEEAGRLGLRRLLVLCSPGQRALGEMVSVALAERSAGLLPAAREHVPVEVADAARDRAAALGADGCVAVGGGSAIGLGKAVALEHGLPVIAVPTTYSGSEMTPVWGLTRDGAKRTGRDPRVLPAAVLYDPELTVKLPVPVSVTSGLNALAHAVEALYAPDASPVTSLVAQEGVRRLADALPEIVADPADVAGRALALSGAWLCGVALGSTRMGLHHQLCHVLGGTFGLPHAATHAVLIPHVLAYNAAAAPSAAAAVSRALGASDPARALGELGRALGVPGSLAELGLCEDDLALVVDRVLAEPYPNPAPPTRDGLTRLLRRAWAGAEAS